MGLWRTARQRRSGLPYPALRGANQLLNASGALAALEALADRLPVSAAGSAQGIADGRDPGALSGRAGPPAAVIFDVAHNPHAAAVLAQNLDSMGFFPRTFAVFGMLRDKDVDGVARRLARRDRSLVRRANARCARGRRRAHSREALRTA